MSKLMRARSFPKKKRRVEGFCYYSGKQAVFGGGYGEVDPVRLINEKKIVAVNDAGLRIGEGHPHARLTDRDVDLIRSLHEEYGIGYNTLAEKFDVSKWAIGRICRYERRAQTPANFKKVHVLDCE